MSYNFLERAKKVNVELLFGRAVSTPDIESETPEEREKRIREQVQVGPEFSDIAFLLGLLDKCRNHAAIQPYANFYNSLMRPNGKAEDIVL